MILYGASQTLLIALFILDWMFWKTNSQREVKAFHVGHGRAGMLDYLWYLVFFISIFTSLFTSIGGTSECDRRKNPKKKTHTYVVIQQSSSSSAFTATASATFG